MTNKTFKSDKALTHCISEYRTFLMFGIQEGKANPPYHLKTNYEDVERHLESQKRMFKAAGYDEYKGEIVKCLVTIIEREHGKGQYHWSDHLSDDQKDKIL